MKTPLSNRRILFANTKQNQAAARPWILIPSAVCKAVKIGKRVHGLITCACEKCPQLDRSMGVGGRAHALAPEDAKFGVNSPFLDHLNPPVLDFERNEQVFFLRMRAITRARGQNRPKWGFAGIALKTSNLPLIDEIIESITNHAAGLI